MIRTLDVNLFYLAFVFYTISTLIYLLTFWKSTGKLASIGSIILRAGFVLQVAGLVIRAINAHFMPVTNMYESLNFFSCAIGFSYFRWFFSFWLFLHCHRLQKRFCP